ncbi:MAG: hypothetical protein LBS55_03930 [Prevotellaceae bacterium]|jgi:hypothetical protein|nr:hypothetical protein [Prevotellaceae bacterium]
MDAKISILSEITTPVTIKEKIDKEVLGFSKQFKTGHIFEENRVNHITQINPDQTVNNHM